MAPKTETRRALIAAVPVWAALWAYPALWVMTATAVYAQIPCAPSPHVVTRLGTAMKQMSIAEAIVTHALMLTNAL